MESRIVATPGSQRPVVREANLVPVTRVRQSVEEVRRTITGRVGLSYGGHVVIQDLKVLRKYHRHLLVICGLPCSCGKGRVGAKRGVEAGQVPQGTPCVIIEPGHSGNQYPCGKEASGNKEDDQA